MATTDADLTKPVTGYNERIDVIDVLRGFALLGIIISHLTSSFSSAIPHMTGRLDMMLLKVVELFIMDKFYLIFSFLFGLSFYIQLQRATAKKTKFVRRFVWRSVILLMIGNIHTVFYTGDVLHVYALLGLLLLLGNKLSNKVLILLSCILIFGNPWLLKLQDITWKQPAEVVAAKAADAALIQKAGILRLQGSFGDVIANNIDLAKRFYFTIIDRHIVILGLFLLGVVAGRKNLFAKNKGNIKTFAIMLAIGITVALATMGMIKMNVTAALGEAGQVIPILLQVALSCIYVAGIVLLYWETPVKKILQVLDPVGKMGLTTYLMQSVFGLVYYYGFGFGAGNYVTVKVALVAVSLFFLFQVVFAAAWMAKFRYGPFEWLWRSLTYLKVQPILK